MEALLLVYDFAIYPLVLAIAFVASIWCLTKNIKNSGPTIQSVAYLLVITATLIAAAAWAISNVHGTVTQSLVGDLGLYADDRLLIAFSFFSVPIGVLILLYLLSTLENPPAVNFILSILLFAAALGQIVWMSQIIIKDKTTPYPEGSQYRQLFNCLGEIDYRLRSGFSDKNSLISNCYQTYYKGPADKKPPPPLYLYNLQTPETYERHGRKLQLISPNGGEFWRRGSMQEIKWSEIDGVKEVTVWLQPYSPEPRNNNSCTHLDNNRVMDRLFIIKPNVPAERPFVWRVGDYESFTGNDYNYGKSIGFQDGHVETGQYTLCISPDISNFGIDTSDGPITIVD